MYLLPVTMASGDKLFTGVNGTGDKLSAISLLPATVVLDTGDDTLSQRFQGLIYHW